MLWNKIGKRKRKKKIFIKFSTKVCGFGGDEKTKDYYKETVNLVIPTVIEELRH